MDFPSIYLSLHLNSLGYSVCRGIDKGGSALLSHARDTHISWTRIQVRLMSSDRVRIMESSLTATPALAAPWVSDFPQKDSEEFIEKSVIYYIERTGFISSIQQKTNHSGKETKITWD